MNKVIFILLVIMIALP